MKKEEMRKVIATYCDYCGEELTNTSHSSIKFESGVEMDFCSTYSNEITETCLDKYKRKTERK